jgi:hypothetical protein
MLLLILVKEKCKQGTSNCCSHFSVELRNGTTRCEAISQGYIMTFLKLAFASFLLASCTNQRCQVQGLDSENDVTQQQQQGVFENKVRRRNSAIKIASDRDRDERFLQTSTIIRFDVYNAATDTKILELMNGTVIDLSQYGLSGPTVLNIEAIATGPVRTVSTQFALDVTLYNRIEGGDRRSLCGNSGGDFGLCKLMKLGTHSLTASVYSQRNATGQLLGSTLVNFEIIESGKTPSPLKPPSPITSSPVSAPVAPPSPPTSSACPVPKVRNKKVDSHFIIFIYEAN